MTHIKNKPSVEEVLAHYGVKGMKWGVRKSRESSGAEVKGKKKGVTLRSDGSITIDKGVSLQRLVRSDSTSKPLREVTYASVLDYDNARYLKIIGGSGPFGGGRDQILGLTTTKKISAPPVKEVTKIVSDKMLKDPKFREANKNAFLGTPITPKELKEIQLEPTGKTAQAWYENANTLLTFDSRNKPDLSYLQKSIRDSVQARGYNALRDENDFGSRLSKAPLIIFSPETSLKVTTITQITKDLRKANKETLKAYKEKGKNWLDQELYS